MDQVKQGHLEEVVWCFQLMVFKPCVQGLQGPYGASSRPPGGACWQRAGPPTLFTWSISILTSLRIGLPRKTLFQ